MQTKQYLQCWKCLSGMCERGLLGHISISYFCISVCVKGIEI